MKGFKKDKCNKGCSRGRYFRNSLHWSIYIINSVNKTKLSCKTYGDQQSFFCSCSQAMESISPELRSITSVDQFKMQLKTYLFKMAYNDQFLVVYTQFSSFLYDSYSLSYFIVCLLLYSALSNQWIIIKIIIIIIIVFIIINTSHRRKGQLTNAISYFLDKTRYYVSLIRC